jgi:dTDP-4-dehydrorhamnose 3,5-epimerase
MIKLVLYDPREKSSTYKEVNQFLIGIHNPMLVQIPAGVYHGWMCVSQEEAIIVNIPTEAYNYEHPDEQRLDPHDNDIPYDWRRKDG